jgi:lipoate-protein ligase A
MRSQTGMARGDIIASLMNSFRQGNRVRESGYTDAELDAARDLVRTKFSSRDWTYRVP